jgi:hypothetical protein
MDQLWLGSNNRAFCKKSTVLTASDAVIAVLELSCNELYNVAQLSDDSAHSFAASQAFVNAPL